METIIKTRLHRVNKQTRELHKQIHQIERDFYKGPPDLDKTFNNKADSIIAKHAMEEIDGLLASYQVIESEDMSSEREHTPTINLTTLRPKGIYERPEYSMNSVDQSIFEMSDEQVTQT